MGADYAYIFLHFVPPRLVRVVDAFTGKPIPHMNVCVQAITTGLGPKQALSSDLTTTDTNGRAFFWPSIINVGLLRSWDGYSIQVTDPKSDFIQNCGPEIGFGMIGSEFGDRFAESGTDGGEHFPVELVKPEALPTNISWFPFMRGADFHPFMSVELIPVLPNPDGCRQVADPRLLQECTRLNTLAENALLQKLVPMYFVDMERSAGTQNIEGWSPQSRVYNAVYERHSTPDRFMVVTIERFPKGENALEHFNDITRAIPDYNPTDVTEDEVLPGQKIKQILSRPSPRAFWASQNLLVLITYPTPSPFDRFLTDEWLRRYPCSGTSDSH